MVTSQNQNAHPLNGLLVRILIVCDQNLLPDCKYAFMASTIVNTTAVKYQTDCFSICLLVGLNVCLLNCWSIYLCLFFFLSFYLLSFFCKLWISHRTFYNSMEQVMLGHNIVTDEWAGAYTPLHTYSLRNPHTRKGTFLRDRT